MSAEGESRIAELEARIETARMDRVRAREREAELEAKLAAAVASLDEAAEYVERFADMRDGDYGGHEPNEAMQLAHSLRQALASIQERA